ncbi:Aste57867_2523 [Aphanomyces stellatus]|uniref:Aste57867_2523 protein n=1 Tax=Aphanomyces stellatus TaxID=120398 RepID=A0A485K8H2_9STRA|nr:hypothetical protein As57867_002516 [Aphanomyces stellatus]VFT79722.1 Aste57867_2523 [Aphanomyces stellatus]
MPPPPERTWMRLFGYVLCTFVWVYTCEGVLAVVFVLGLAVGLCTCRISNLLSGVSRVAWQVELWIYRIYVPESTLRLPRVEVMTLDTTFWTAAYFLLWKGAQALYFAGVFAALRAAVENFIYPQPPTTTRPAFIWDVPAPTAAPMPSAFPIVALVGVFFSTTILLVWFSTWFTSVYYKWVMGGLPVEESATLNPQRGPQQKPFLPLTFSIGSGPPLFPHQGDVTEPTTFPPFPPFPPSGPMGPPPPPPPPLGRHSSSQTSVSSVGSASSSASHVSLPPGSSRRLSTDGPPSSGGGVHPLMHFKSTLTERNGVLGFPVPPPPPTSADASDPKTHGTMWSALFGLGGRPSLLPSADATSSTPVSLPPMPTAANDAVHSIGANAASHHHIHPPHHHHPHNQPSHHHPHPVHRHDARGANKDAALTLAKHQLQALHHLLLTRKEGTYDHARVQFHALEQMVADVRSDVDREQLMAFCGEMVAALDEWKASLLDHQAQWQQTEAAVRQTEAATRQAEAAARLEAAVQQQQVAQQAMENARQAEELAAVAAQAKQDAMRSMLEQHLEGFRRFLADRTIDNATRHFFEQQVADLERQLAQVDQGPDASFVAALINRPYTPMPGLDPTPSRPDLPQIVQNIDNHEPDTSVFSTTTGQYERPIRDDRPVQAGFVVSPTSYDAPDAAGPSYGLLSPVSNTASSLFELTDNTSPAYGLLSPQAATVETKDFEFAPTYRTVEGVRDKVHFLAFAPPTVGHTMHFALNVWAFLVHQRPEMLEQARAADAAARQLSREMLVQIRRGALTTVHLEVPVGFALESDATQQMTWAGDVTSVPFNVHCTSRAPLGTALFKATIVVGTDVVVVRAYLSVAATVVDGDDAAPNELRCEYEVLPKTFPEIPYQRLNVQELIGRGNFGDAFRAEYNGKQVVVKTLRAQEGHREPSPEIVQEFRHEAAVLHMFGHHPNIVPFVGASTDPTMPLSLVTEYLPWGSIEEQYNRRLTAPQKLRLLADAAAGVLNMHEGGFLHRDIAARNCLVDANLRAKVCDFGMCRRVDANGVGQFAPGVGPLKYMAPESLQPPHAFSYQSDVYGFGVLMWETFAEAKPFARLTAPEAASRVLEGGRLDVHLAVIPARVQTLMAACFQEDPAKRPTMAAIEAACRDLAVD